MPFDRPLNAMNPSLKRLDTEQKRLIMIGGKGGVGKTTCASAIALHFSAQGKKTLIISSDPTPSLSDIFEMDIGDQEKPVKDTKNLYGIEISSDVVLKKWKDRFGPEIYEVVSSFTSLDYDFVDYIGGAPGIEEEYQIIDPSTGELRSYVSQILEEGRLSQGARSVGLARRLIELCREHQLASPALDRLVHLNDVGDLFLEEDPDFVLAGDYANLVKVYGFWNLHALIGGDVEKLLQEQKLGDSGGREAALRSAYRYSAVSSEKERLAIASQYAFVIEATATGSSSFFRSSSATPPGFESSWKKPFWTLTS
jgi:hypothetical protein